MGCHFRAGGICSQQRQDCLRQKIVASIDSLMSGIETCENDISTAMDGDM